MKITIIAIGSRGDVQPHIALGVGLKEAGHSVGVLTSEDFRELTVTSGLAFHEVGGSMQAISREMNDLLERGNFLKILTKMGEAAANLALLAAKNGLEACQGSDLLVSGLGGLFVAQAISEKLGVPLVPAYLYPFTPTREFPGILVPVPQSPLTSWANPLSHRLTQLMFWLTTLSADNKARKQVLDLPSAPLFGPFKKHENSGITLYGYSPSIIPPPKDWGENQFVTGYWQLPAPPTWEPPADLVHFLEAGPPPIYIGFGSMSSKHPEDTAKLVLRALELSGQRGVISSGWGGMAPGQLPDSIFMVGSIPHDWLFPRMAAVVHHGGAGTTGTGLTAGVPSIITPFMGDQAFWANRVYALGVGPKPIPRRRLDAAKLAASIHTAISDTNVRTLAASLGEKIRSENGVALAAEIVAAAF